MWLQDKGKALVKKWPCSCLYSPTDIFNLLKLSFGLVLVLASVSIQAQSSPPEFIDNTAFFTSNGKTIQAFVQVRVNSGPGPVADITLNDLAFPENETGVTVSSIVVVGLETPTSYSFSDDRFEIVDDILKLKEGVLIDFETEMEVPLTISATDTAGNPVSFEFLLDVQDVNEEPFDLSIDNNFLPPLVDGGIVGEVAAQDQDADELLIFSVDGDERFEVVDGILRLVEGEVLEENIDIPVTVIATDKGGLTTQLAVVVTTNPDNVDVTPSPSTITFLQYGSSGDAISIEEASCTASETINAGSTDGDFLPFQFPGTVRLAEADTYAVGDPIFISVADADQNIDPRLIDSILITIRVDTTGDSEVLRLFESDVDSGVFYGFVQSTSQTGSEDDCQLSVGVDARLSATYIDSRDNTDTADAVSNVALLGFVFDDTTGEPINDIILTLVRMPDSTPANVRGDGPEFGLFPSVIKTGAEVFDSVGKTYTFSTGEYRFPAVPEGDYFIEVFNDIAWQISEKSDEEIRSDVASAVSARAVREDMGLVLLPASRGTVFHVRQGAIPRIDIPLAQVVPPDDAPDPTRSTIEFLQYSPIAGVGEPVNVEETFCVAGGNREVTELDGDPLPLPGVVNLMPVSTLKAGQPVFVRVTDLDQNKDPDARERITVELSVATLGETEFLELTETEPDSGVFVGYVQTSEAETDVQSGDCLLSVVKNENIFTTYTDSFDNTDTSSTLVLIDPFGILFSTSSGEPIDGVTVTLINSDTGLPAEVFGDGPSFAPFPSSIVSGAGTVDDAGIEYDFPPGMYRFPFVEAGFYRLELTNLPEGFTVPSVVSDVEIQALPGAPFEIVEGSRLQVFEVPVGPALHIDIPIDVPDNVVVLTKSVSRSVASIGEFVQYKVRIANEDGGPARNVTVTDTLPPGLRVQKGSFRLNGDKIADPQLDPGGSIFSLLIPVIEAGTSAEISYVVEITAGTPVGQSINRVSATGETLVDVNTAEARIFVTEDLLRSKAILTGQVKYGQCDDPEAIGVSDVLIYMEDGTGVLTDLDGNWHIEGVVPGTHVVQLDLESLEDRYQIAECNTLQNRNSGRAYSQFVDVRGGTVWKTDFHIVDRPPPKSEVTLDQSLTLLGDKIKVNMKVDIGEEVPLTDASVFYRTPKGWKISADSVRLNTANVRPEVTIIGNRFRLPTSGRQSLEFLLEPKEAAKPEVEKLIENNILLRPVFDTRSASLSDSEDRKIENALAKFKGAKVQRIIVKGHSDNIPIARKNRAEYADNYVLSKARANSVATIVSQYLGVDAGLVSTIGVGPDEPISTNSTAVGRAANRRVEVEVQLLQPRDERELVLRPEFETRKATLSSEETARISASLDSYKDLDIKRIVVIGHSDSMPIAPQNRKEFKDNYSLSEARASSIGSIATAVLGLRPDQVEVIGAGPDLPIADNKTRDGRARNRRVEIRVVPRNTDKTAVKEVESNPAFVSEKALLSKAIVRYKSIPTPEGKGKTRQSEIDIRDLPAAGSMSNRVMGYALGSWDKFDADDGSDADAALDTPPGIVSLSDGQLISNDVVGVRVKLKSELLPRLEVGGVVVPNTKIGITIERSDGTTLYTYVGVDFGKDPGERIVRLQGLDKFDKPQFEEVKTVVRTGRIKFIRMSEMPGNVADGKTPVSLKVDLLDGNMRLVKSTAQLRIIESTLIPYTSEADLRTGRFQIGKVDVTSNGIAKFFPVSKAGYYRLVLAYEDFKDDITIQIKPESRDWVMVGLGEGIVGYNNITGNMEALDARDLEDGFYEEGRIAFFAKGMIKGEWLTTLSYDTDRQKDGNLFQRINAGQYYTLYGDSSAQRFDAASQEKLYVRVENDKVNMTYGDFSTNLSRLDLSEYSRRMTGLRVAYIGDRIAGTAFASQTTQAFIRDDIQGNGTSGIYKLSTDGVLLNSEKITFEVRDRFHNEIVLDEAPKTRDFDYSIDYERGELIFKKPVFSQDFEGNPLFIVARYEIDTSGREKLNIGGRLAMAFNAERGILGTTVIREEVQGREAELTAADLTYRFGDSTELIAEIATSKQNSASGNRKGDAYSVSVRHQSARIDGVAFIREEEAGFGIGQNSILGKGTRQIGANATVRVNELVSMNAQMYRDESLEDGRTRDVVSSSADFRSEQLSYGVGLQSARDKGGERPATESQQLTGQVQTQLMDRRLKLRASGEAPLGSSDNEAFPTRLLLGADYALTDKIGITGQQEFTWGDKQDSQRTIVGLRSNLWEGAALTSTMTQEQGEDGQRVFANYGLLQSFQYNADWAFDFGVDRTQTIKDVPVIEDSPNPNAKPIFGNENGDFTALFAGANYTTDLWRYTTRLEYRKAKDDQYNFSAGALRNLEGGIVLASIFDGRIVDGVNERTTDNLLNFGFAYRPDESKWTVFNRLELAFRKQGGAGFDTTSRKIVNNLNANYVWDEKTQLSMQYAFKYVVDTIDGVEYKGFTDLIGGELRRNLSDKWDIGLRLNALHSWNANVIDYSYGVSLGRQFATNTWASVGYNFDGFRDSDFDDSDYTAKGVYLKFRFKFDQDTAQQLFKEKNVFKKQGSAN